MLLVIISSLINQSCDNLKELIPEIDAVEMEGGAIAQVATQENIPWLVVRTISDSADEEASVEFSVFLERYKKLSWCFINNLLESCVKKYLKKVKNHF